VFFFAIVWFSKGLTCCLSVLEAISASLPIIATNIASIPEVVTEGQMGYLFDPGDQKALRDHGSSW
jgi:glycosyltransferase involved in cell wall biosynthesis